MHIETQVKQLISLIVLTNNETSLEKGKKSTLQNYMEFDVMLLNAKIIFKIQTNTKLKLTNFNYFIKKIYI